MPLMVFRSRLSLKSPTSLPGERQAFRQSWNEGFLHIQNLCIITCSYLLLEGGLIVFNTFEPQSVHDSGVQPSHHGHRYSYQGWIQHMISFGNPVLAIHRDIRTVLCLHFHEEEPWQIEYQCENPRARNDHLKWAKSNVYDSDPKENKNLQLRRSMQTMANSCLNLACSKWLPWLIILRIIS